MSESRVLLCIPVFNERPVIDKTLVWATRVLDAVPHCDLLIVDDGSSDGSEDCIDHYHHSRARVARHGTRRGLGAVISTAWSAARETGHGYLCLWPGNCRIPGEHVVRMLTCASYSGTEFLHGSRYVQGGGGNTPAWRSAIIRTAGAIASCLYGAPISDITCGLRLFPVSLVNECELQHLSCAGYSGEQMLTVWALCRGLSVRPVPVRFCYTAERRYSHLMKRDWHKVLRPWCSLANLLAARKALN